MPDAVGISVLVPTFNEEANIRECLECLTWADQVIVVDSFSTDATLEIAAEFTDEIHQHEYVNSATQKNWAIDTLDTRGRWTLIVDSDERIVPELAEEIQRIIAEDDPRYAGYFINRRNYFFGGWMKRGGLYPNWNLRLFRTGQGRYEDKEVHADVAIDGEGEVGYLEHDILHFSYRTISDFVRKTNRYSTWDARERMKERHDDSAISAGSTGGLRTILQNIYWVLPAKPLVRFLYQYIIKAGFLDGRRGLMVACLYAFEEFLIGAKVWQMRANPEEPE